MSVPSLQLDTSGTKFGITHLKSKGLGVEESVIKFIRAKAADDCGPLGARILTSAAQHLEDRLEAELFGPRAQASQRAVQALAKSLHHAGKELVAAADALSAHGAIQNVIKRARNHGMQFLAEAGAVLEPHP